MLVGSRGVHYFVVNTQTFALDLVPPFASGGAQILADTRYIGIGHIHDWQTSTGTAIHQHQKLATPLSFGKAIADASEKFTRTKEYGPFRLTFYFGERETLSLFDNRSGQAIVM